MEKGWILFFGCGVGFCFDKMVMIWYCDDVGGWVIKCVIFVDGDFCICCSDEGFGSLGWIDMIYGCFCFGWNIFFDLWDIEYVGCVGNEVVFGIVFGCSVVGWCIIFVEDD